MHKILSNVHQGEGGLVDAQDEEKMVDAQDPLIVSPATPINPSRLQSGWTLDNDISIVHLQRQSPDFDYQQKIRFLRKWWSSQTR